MKINNESIKLLENNKKIKVISSLNNYPIKLRLLRYTNLGKNNDICSAFKGMVVNEKGHVYGRQFDKIKSYTIQNKFEPCGFNVYEFYDGIPIYMFRMKNVLYFYSDIGFTGEEIDLAKELFNKKVKNPIQDIPEGFTYNFQLVSPKFPRIINYENDNLILISVFNIKRNLEVDYNQLHKFNYSPIVNNINNFRTKDVFQYLVTNDNFSRGNIIHFNENGFNKRIKIQNVEYLSKLEIIKNYKKSNLLELFKSKENPLKLFNEHELPKSFTDWVKLCKKTYKENKNLDNVKEYFREEEFNNLNQE
jgi:hypothetical protein